MGFKEELLAELKQGTREPEEENSKNKKATNSEIIKYAAAYKSKDRKSSGKKTQTKSEKTGNREKPPQESITRGFDASQKQYDDYVKSGTHRENQKNALDRAMEMIFSSGSSAADAPATLFRADDIQEQQLRAQKDYYQGQVDAEENAKILAPRLEEIRAMPEEDRQALEQYVAGRADDFYKALDPAYNGGLAADVTRSADFQAYDLYQKYGVAKVRELAEALEWEQSQKAAEKAAAQGQQAASGGALGTVGANLGTIPANIVGAITAPLGYARELTTRTGDLATLNPYNEGTWVNAWSGNVRDTTARNIEGGIGGVGGQVASMGYQGLMSAADSLARIAFTGGNAAASLGLAATGSFGQTLQEVSQRGGSPAQAVLQATANASFEVLTEKLPLDNLLDMAKAGKKPMAQTVMNILGQAGIEAGTEEVNFVAQLLTEAAILREKSGYNTQVNDLVANGMSYADAKAQASKALWDEALQIAGVSGFSGVLSAGGASAYSYVTGPQASQAPSLSQQVTKDAAETLTTNMAQESQQNTESQGPAKEKPLPKTELDAIREAANMPQEPAAQTVEPDLQKAIDMTIPPDAGSASKPEQYTQEELDALPVMEYDDALAYRNSLLDQQQTGSVGPAKRDFAGTADYDNLLSDTNAQRDRPGDVRPVEVPKVDAQGKQVSEFVGNAYGAEVTPDSFIPTIRQLVMRGKVSHDVLSNEQALRDAAEEVSRRGIVSALETVRNTARRGKVSAHDVAMAELIYNYTVNSGDNLSQQMAADAFTSLAEMATSGGRAVQLYGMMKKMTPEGMVYSLQADIDRTVRRLEAQGKIKLKGEDLSKLPDDVKALYKEAARNLRNAKTPEEISDAEAELKAVTEQAYCAIASRLEATAKDRWDAWRYMSMLFNVKTQVRNLGGNAAMMPYTSAKRVVNSAMQSMFIRDKSKRTASVLTPADHALVRWARADAKSDAVRKLLDGTEKAGGEATSEIEKRRRVFKSDVLEKIRKLSHDIPSGADLLFKNGEYSRSLASALKAKGYSLADVQAGSVPSDVMEQCRTLAINEALRATFNDSNALSGFVSGLKIHNPDNAVKKFANVLVEGLIPFKRTPANVAVRAIEYSPAGLVRGIWNAAFDVHRGKITAAQAIDRISGGLVGTGVYVLGCFMAKGLFGVKLTGKLDDEDEKRRGRQEYSLEFSIDGQEYSYSINWLAPANIPLFMGVNTYQAWQESGEEPSISTLTAVLQGVGYAFEPMLSMSFMSGVNSLVDSVRYSEDGRQVYAIAATLATNYFTQGIPALAKQTYQAANSDTKTTYADSEDPLIQDAQYVIGKVPVLGDLAGVKVDKVNAWGETETEDNPLSRAFNAFSNPGTLKEIDDRPIENEISRLNSLVSEGVSPPTVKKNVSYTDTSGQMQERRLTADEYTQMQKIQGTVRKMILSGLIQDKSYQKLTPTQQAQAVKLAYDIAAERAKSSVLDDYYSQASSWLRDIADNNWTGAAPQIVQKVTQDSLNEAIKSLTDAYKSGFDPTQDEERLSASYDAYSKMDARTKRTVREAVDTDTRRYLQARGAGLSQDRYIGIVQDIKGLEPWEGRTKVSDSQTMEAIADAGLSQDQTVAVMKMYMDTNDYADERLDWFIDKGMDPGEFADAWAAYQMESSTGKGQADRTRERYREMGYTHAEAAYLYKLFSGREKPWEE